MLRMSWIKCDITGKLRACWIRTAAPTLLAGTLHTFARSNPSQTNAADREPLARASAGIERAGPTWEGRRERTASRSEDEHSLSPRGRRAG